MNFRIVVSVILYMCLIMACSSNTSTRSLLDGDFLTNGAAPIQLLSPADSAVTGTTPLFAWAPREGISTYNLEIATDKNFANIVISVSVPATQYQLLDSDTILNSQQYFWRVKGEKLNNPLTSAVFNFNVISITASGGTVYVDANFDPAKSLTSYGTKTAPFRTIQNALSSADNYRKYNAGTPMQILVAQGNYGETFSMRPGISIWGGYESANWSRNIKNYVSTIAPTLLSGLFADSATASAYLGTTQIDGFTLNVSSTIIGGCSIFRVDGGHIKITNNIMTLNCVNTSSNVILILNGGSAIISNNTITGINTSNGISGVNFSGVTGPNTVSNNFIFAQNTGGSIGQATGISSGNSTVTVTNNVIYAENISSTNRAVALDIFNDATLTITNNTMSGKNDVGMSAFAIRMQTSSGSAASATLSNNILFTNTTATGYVFAEITATTTSPTLLSKNLIFGTTSLYLNSNATIINDSGLDGILNGTPNNELDTVASCGTSACSAGNIGTTLPLANGVFASAFTLSDRKTWQIKNNGPADLDSSGGFSSGDIGADILTVGPQ